jgi:hypothetical protein
MVEDTFARMVKINTTQGDRDNVALRSLQNVLDDTVVPVFSGTGNEPRPHDRARNSQFIFHALSPSHETEDFHPVAGIDPQRSICVFRNNAAIDFHHDLRRINGLSGKQLIEQACFRDRAGLSVDNDFHP